MRNLKLVRSPRHSFFRRREDDKVRTKAPGLPATEPLTFYEALAVLTDGSDVLYQLTEAQPPATPAR